MLVVEKLCQGENTKYLRVSSRFYFPLRLTLFVVGEAVNHVIIGLFVGSFDGSDVENRLGVLDG